MTRDVLLTLSLMLGAALAARFIASLIRVPEILLLVLVGALFGPSLLDVIDVPLDSIGAQLLFTLGVSLILFSRRTQPFARGAEQGPGRARDAGRSRGRADHGDHRRRRPLRLRPLLDGGPADGCGALAPTDPAILIPLFSRSRLRPKLAQTVVAESAFNDPTGAVLALALAGVLLSGDASHRGARRRFRRRPRRSAASSASLAGVLLAATISSRRAGIWRESSAAAVLAVVTIGYFSLDTAGGSGYLGAFLAGLIVGNMERLGLAMHSRHECETRGLRLQPRRSGGLSVLWSSAPTSASISLGEYCYPALAVLAVLLL